MNLFEKVFRELNKAKVEYLVVGGVAVNLYGYLRFTGDLDLLLFLDKENLRKMDKVMKKMKYSERLPVSVLALEDKIQVRKWLMEKNMKAYTFNPPKNNLLQIDIIIEDSLKFSVFKKKKNIKKMGALKIPVVSIKDIIKMKKKAHRDKDMIDLQVLEYLSML